MNKQNMVLLISEHLDIIRTHEPLLCLIDSKVKEKILSLRNTEARGLPSLSDAGPRPHVPAARCAWEVMAWPGAQGSVGAVSSFWETASEA